MTYMMIQHPRTGEIYAVEIGDDGQIARAAGPLHHSDSREPDDILAFLDNQQAEDTRQDAAWLTRELAIEENA